MKKKTLKETSYKTYEEKRIALIMDDWQQSGASHTWERPGSDKGDFEGWFYKDEGK